MHFGTKNYLKNNHNHTTKIQAVTDFHDVKYQLLLFFLAYFSKHLNSYPLKARQTLSGLRHEKNCSYHHH
jgi:hypothetical protein